MLWLTECISIRHLSSSRAEGQINSMYPSQLAQTNPSFCSPEVCLEGSTWEAERSCAVMLLRDFIILTHRANYPQVTQRNSIAQQQQKNLFPFQG